MADFTMVRGDDTYVRLRPTIDNVGIALDTGDVLRFKVFDTQGGSAIISKTATSADQDADTLVITIKIDAEDTEDLNIAAETEYAWEAEMYIAESGDYITPYRDRRLVIVPDRITPAVREAS